MNLIYQNVQETSEFIKQISSLRPLNETDIIQLNWANVKKHPPHDPNEQTIKHKPQYPSTQS